MTRIGVAVFLVGLLGAPCVVAQNTGASLSPVLVELFTSEGCSSCPPADALLARLEGTLAPSGQPLIVLSEHVTYWNQLGWADPYSLQFFSDRQNVYGSRLGLDEIYTPQVVVNGAAQALGSDRSAVLKAVRQQALPLPLTFHLLSSRSNGPGLAVMYTVSGNVPIGGAEVYAMLVDDHDTTRVERGENAGRTLSHVAVVRGVGKGVILKAGEQTLVQVGLPAALRSRPLVGRRLVLIAQLRGQGRVVGLASEAISAGSSASPGGVVDASVGR